MVARRNLHPTEIETLRTLAATAAAPGRNQRTGPAGTIDLGNTGELAWRDPAGTRHSVRQLPGLLDQGLSTVSRMNTVSASPPPASVDGYPAGALWTQIAERDGKRVVIGTWQLTDGAWQSVAEDASRLVIGQLDVGLIDAALLGARLIEASALVTPSDGDGYRARVDAGGFWVQRTTPDGQTETLARLGPNGENYLTIGESVVRADRIATPALDVQHLSIASKPLDTHIRDHSRLVGLVTRRENTPFRQSPTALLEINALFRRGRVYRIVASPVSGSIASTGQQWAMMRTEIQMRQVAGVPIGLNSDQTVQNSHVWVEGSQDRQFTVPGMSMMLDTRDWREDQTWGVLLAIRDASPAGAASFATWGNYDIAMELAIYDEGIPGDLAMSWVWRESGTNPPAPTPPPVNRHFDIKNFDAASYWVNTNQWDAGYPGQVIAGSYNNSAATLRQGLFAFGNVQGATAGNVGWARIEFRCDHTYNHAGGYVDAWAFSDQGVPPTRPLHSTGLLATGIYVRAGQVSGFDIPWDKLGLIRAGQLNSVLLSATGRTDPAWYGRYTDAWIKGSYTV
jgi:hypothetical protein